MDLTGDLRVLLPILITVETWTIKRDVWMAEVFMRYVTFVLCTVYEGEVVEYNFTEWVCRVLYTVSGNKRDQKNKKYAVN